MSDNNENGMRNFDNDQPDVFQMQDESNQLLPYEGFMAADYTPKTEERTEQKTTDPDPNGEKINYDDEPIAPEKKEETNNPNPGENPEKVDYEDPNVPLKTDEFKAEEVIQKLEALGFKVEKNGVIDPLQAKEFEIKELDRINNDLKNFVQQDDLVLCREHVIDETIKQWRKEGREPDLTSEEFNIQVNYEMAQFEDNPRLAKLQANDVKNLLNSAIQKNEGKKVEIFTEVKTTRDKEIQENRQALQGVFDGYNGKTLFGQKIQPEHLKTAYRSIISGEFTKQTESDRSLQAEFALYQMFRKDVEKNGGGTYNEGVAAAVKALEGNGPKVESSLATTVSRSGAGSVVDRVSAWKAAEKVEEPTK